MNLIVPHRRWNPLQNNWVLVSPQRAMRPWLGQVSTPNAEKLEAYDASCALCPANKRSNSEENPDYKSVFVFNNDFPALFSQLASAEIIDNFPKDIVRLEQTRGECRVVVFSPRHDLTIPELPVESISIILDSWKNEYNTLISKDFIKYVSIFENKGELMGCSNPHPHSQIWATEYVPSLPSAVNSSQRAYWKSHNTSLLSDYLRWEVGQEERIVCSNEEWICLVPFWAQWPYETMIIPSGADISDISEIPDSVMGSWAAIYKEITIRYDNLFKCSFPYSMGIFQKSKTDTDTKGVQLHQSFFPPLLRSSSIKKFMVGFEMCAEAQRDLTPEQAAAKLRECPTTHYLTN